MLFWLPITDLTGNKGAFNMRKGSLAILVMTILIQCLFLTWLNIEVYTSTNLTLPRKVLPPANLAVMISSLLAIVSIRNIRRRRWMHTESKLSGEHHRYLTQRHEQIRHIQTLQAMLNLNEVEVARDYIEEIAELYRYNHKPMYAGNQSLTALLNCWHKIAANQGIEFTFSINCSINEIALSFWELLSILENLLDNALEAAVHEETNRRVSLVIKEEDNRIALYIANTGDTITDKQLPRLFMPGYTTKASKARGYGLYIVKSLVDSYRGRITVIRKPKTMFVISLPKNEVLQDPEKTYPAG
jgi:sensor histidine kinase regulating citrate/malate metabolism